VQLSELIIQTAEAGLDLQQNDGSFPSGTNGPYEDNETPVRNTSHWVITFLKAYEYSNDGRFLSAAGQAVKYLCSSSARPNEVAFYHREGNRFEGQDRTNGLIGQAWTIEALAVASEYIKSEEVSRIASETFQAHPFNDDAGLWKRIDIDGQVVGYDNTFNHQLWFAMAGLLLLDKSTTIEDNKKKSINHKLNCFLSNLDSVMSIFPSGLIIHPLLPIRPLFKTTKRNPGLQKSILKKWAYISVKKPINVVTERSLNNVLRKSRPYHSFNLYALAIIHEIRPELDFWDYEKHKKIIDYSKRNNYLQSLKTSEYGYKYNPPGFELPYAWYVFDGKLTRKAKRLLNEQLRYSYDSSSNLLLRNTSDEQTNAARFYELTRIPDLEISL